MGTSLTLNIARIFTISSLNYKTGLRVKQRKKLRESGDMVMPLLR